jgi:hypothetical protein
MALNISAEICGSLYTILCTGKGFPVDFLLRQTAGGKKIKQRVVAWFLKSKMTALEGAV